LRRGLRCGRASAVAVLWPCFSASAVACSDWFEHPAKEKMNAAVAKKTLDLVC
jgi:hypothetical protein